MLDRVFGFLGLETLDVGLDSLPRYPWTRQFVRGPSGKAGGGPLNAHSYPEMRPKTRVMLLDYFKPHNQRLSKLLQRDFDWNS